LETPGKEFMRPFFLLKMSPLLNAILCSAEEIQEKQTSSSSCNDFALYDKFNCQPKNLAYFKFFWRKAYSNFLNFKSKNSLEGALNSSLFEKPHMKTLRILKPILCE
jgi:hypothetical protein